MKIKNRLKFCMVVIAALFSLSAVSCSLESEFTNPLDPDFTMPSPEEVRAAVSETSIRLSWKINIESHSESVGNEIWTVIERSYNGNEYSIIDTLKKFSKTYVIKGTFNRSALSPRYRIKVIAGTKISVYGYTLGCTSYLPPTNMNTDLKTFPSSCVVGWEDNSNCEIGFELERKIGNDGDYAVITKLPGDRPVYVDKDITVRNITYYYRARAVFKDFYSSYDSTNVFIE